MKESKILQMKNRAHERKMIQRVCVAIDRKRALPNLLNNPLVFFKLQTLDMKRKLRSKMGMSVLYLQLIYDRRHNHQLEQNQLTEEKVLHIFLRVVLLGYKTTCYSYDHSEAVLSLQVLAHATAVVVEEAVELSCQDYHAYHVEDLLIDDIFLFTLEFIESDIVHEAVVLLLQTQVWFRVHVCHIEQMSLALLYSVRTEPCFQSIINL